MNNTDENEIDLEITKEEHARLTETLATMVNEEADEMHWGGSNSLGAFEGTEIDELFEEAIHEVISNRDSFYYAKEVARDTDIPKTISVSKKQHKAILKERNDRENKIAEEGTSSRLEMLQRMMQQQSLLMKTSC